MYLYARAPASQFVRCRLIGILKASPPADVINDQHAEIGPTRLNIFEQSLQRLSSANIEPAFPLVSVCPDYLIAALLGIPLDGSGLVVGRVLLMLGRHADIFGRPDPGWYAWCVRPLCVQPSDYHYRLAWRPAARLLPNHPFTTGEGEAWFVKPQVNFEIRAFG